MRKIASITVECDNVNAEYTRERYVIRVSYPHIVAVRVGMTMTEINIIDLDKMTLQECYVRHVGTYEEICVSNINSITIVTEVE
jgi:hypothetical protein